METKTKYRLIIGLFIVYCVVILFLPDDIFTDSPALDFVIKIVLILVAFLIVIKPVEKLMKKMNSENKKMFVELLNKRFKQVQFSDKEFTHEQTERFKVLDKYDEYLYTDLLVATRNDQEFIYRSELLQSDDKSYLGMSIEFEVGEIPKGLRKVHKDLKENEKVSNYEDNFVFLIQGPPLFSKRDNEKEINEDITTLQSYVDRFTKISKDLMDKGKKE